MILEKREIDASDMSLEQMDAAIDVRYKDAPEKAKRLKAVNAIVQAFTKDLQQHGAYLAGCVQIGNFKSENVCDSIALLVTEGMNGDLEELTDDMLRHVGAVAVSSGKTDMLHTAMAINNMRKSERALGDVQDAVTPLISIMILTEADLPKVKESLGGIRNEYVKRQMEIAPSFIEESELEAMPGRYSNEFDAMVEIVYGELKAELDGTPETGVAH